MTQEHAAATLPHSDEAERSVLGAVLLDNRQFDRCVEMVQAPSFYSLRHRKIFTAMEAMSERGVAIDLVTLKSELERLGDLQSVGGPAYLAELVHGVPRSAHVEHYARIVKEKSVQRELIRASQTILASAMEPEGTADELLDEAEKAIFRVAEHRLAGASSRSRSPRSRASRPSRS